MIEAADEFRIVIEHGGLRKHEYSILKHFGVPGRDEATPEGRDEMDRRMGAGIEQSIKDWIPLIQFDKQIQAAFDGIQQKVGPPDSFNDVHVGEFVTRCWYQTFGWQSADPAKIVARFNDLAATIKAVGGLQIVWRRRPTLISKAPEDQGGKFFASCRLHVLPYVELSGAKLEGDKMPEA